MPIPQGNRVKGCVVAKTRGIVWLGAEHPTIIYLGRADSTREAGQSAAWR
ncbi:hypothetical protein SAMN05421720_11076 [Rhodospira trueperi]|uniref:Uncharacterized protein n=1 Tax=Rhodospira trueperi TaxID=69960 RepID=A0A1G7F2U2_9PROT|nr:hypothetical protein SAMN05421720_11076 [Rhodospira trueperi]